MNNVGYILPFKNKNVLKLSAVLAGSGQISYEGKMILVFFFFFYLLYMYLARIINAKCRSKEA